MTIKFESSGLVYNTHKFILQAQADCFENLNDNQYVFTKDQDEEAAKSLVKFFYTGTLEYSNESQLVTFMILSNHLKVKSISEFKVPPKVYLNGIIAYVEKDLTNRVGEFDNLVASVNFKKLEKEDLTKLYAKKKWLQKSSTFLNIIIMKDMDSDGSGSGSDKSDKSSETEEEEDDEDEDGGIPHFDKKMHGNNLVIDKKNKRKIKYNGSGWQGSALGSIKNCPKWAAKLVNGLNNYLMLGMAPKTINLQGDNYSKCGYYIYLPTCTKYSGKGDSNTGYGSGSINQGTIYSVKFDKKKMEITFFFEWKINGCCIHWFR